ncbi:FHA domain-containing protein [Myxococcus sp. AM009]|uniref:FHA domain-containing protein n=1 Tax=unclassified Myxococcus TaxID=2648731 RepID=UPI0015950775|nr:MULTISPECIES: FHA domain-containing protein [unclassified Myxococcus]NVI99905.1 FHA domain-containing protein [Myxococcus sp. AM009]NVJ17530.1 FHA domain-containing protein [Myxococcus sp. AM010]
MIDQNSRPARKVGIADHLWETFEDMAQQMGSDRDALINQALFMFARLNGFLEVKSRSEAAVAPAAAAAPMKPVQAAASAPPRPSAPPVLAPAPRPESTPPPARPPVRATPEERASANGLDNDPVRREVAERVLETAAELERLIKGKNSEPPPPADDLVEEDEEPLPEAEDPGLLDEEPLPEEADEEPADDLAEEEEVGALYLVTESGDQEQIVKERFVIGRGKHCDFVINSGKVSREHAVISHEGDDWIIEDLGSSNGTWFNKQRIKRRKIEDGDEYFICSEKIRLLVR